MSRGATDRPFYGSFAWAFDLLVERPVTVECAHIAAVLSARAVPRDARLLDAGCGTGRYALTLAGLGYRVTGLDLSPELIARAHHISVRYLHRLFAADGTSVSRWVKERRLAGCRRELADPSLVRLSVGAIAARWGIHDAAAFSRTFRAAYGVSPREYRLRTLGMTPGSLPRRAS